MNTQQLRIANTAYISKDMSDLLSKESHHIHTPFETARNIIKSIDFNGKNLILVLYNSEFVYSLVYDYNVNPNRIVFITDHYIKKLYAKTVCGLKNNAFVVTQNKSIMDYLKEMKSKKNLKFDVVIANPPYDKGKHLDFLELSFDLLNQDGQCVFIHPSDWLVQKKKTSSRTPARLKHKKLRDKFDLHESYIRFIDNPFGKSAQIFFPIVITSITKNNNPTVRFVDERTTVYNKAKINHFINVQLSSLSQISQWGNGLVEENILKKIYSNLDDNCGMYLNSNEKSWFVSLSSFSGNGYTELRYLDNVTRKISNMFSVTNSHCISPTNIPQTASTGKTKDFLSFEDESCAQNCIDYLMKTKFMRGYLAIIKTNASVGKNLMSHIPYLDFTRQWTDNDLYTYFNFSQEEIDYIESIVEKITE